MHSIDSDRTSMHVEWILSNICNYRCSYCSEDLYAGTSGFIDLEIATQFFSMLSKRYADIPIRLSLTGGEPTLWHSFWPFVESLDGNIQVAVVSNGARPKQFWQKMAASDSPIKAVTLSYHPERADLNHLLDIAASLQDTQEVTLVCVLHPHYLEQTNKVFAELEKRQLKINAFVRAIRQHHKNNQVYAYSEEAAQILTKKYIGLTPRKDILWGRGIIIDQTQLTYSELVRKLVSPGYNSFFGWECDAGARRLVIWHDGEIYPATCKTAKKNRLGNIRTAEFTPIENLICGDDICPCIADIQIPKRKSNATPLAEPNINELQI